MKLTLILAASTHAFQVWNGNNCDTSNVVRIGVNLDRTVEEPLNTTAYYGDWYNKTSLAMNGWLAYLANQPALLPNACVYLDYRENNETASSAVDSVMALMDRNMIALIGSTDSSLTEATAVLSAAKSIPHCDGSSTSAELSNKRLLPSFFRTIVSDALQARVFYDFVISQGWKRGNYGTGLLKNFQDANSANLINIVSQQTIPFSQAYDTTYWTPALNVIQNANAFVILIFAADNNVRGLIDAAQARGMWTRNYAWIGSEAMKTTHIATAAPGMIVLNPSLGSGPAFDKFNAIWNLNIASINARNNDISDYAYSYASCVDLLIRGLDDFMVKNPNLTLAQLTSGQLNPQFGRKVTTIFNFPNVNTPAGNIALDNVTGDPKLGYDVSNVQNGNYVLVKQWNDGNLSSVNPIVYLEGSLITPLDTINPADYTNIVPVSSAMAIVVIVLTVLVFAALVFCGYIFWSYRTHKVIRATSVPSQMVILFGLLLPLLDVIPSLGVPTTAGCIVDAWLIFLSYSIVFSAILVKLYRIYRVFYGIEVTTSGLTNKSVLIQTAALVSISILLLLIWTLVDPPKSTLVNINDKYYQYTCASGWAGAGFKITLFVYSGLLLAGCTLFAFWTRNVRGDFNEAHTVGVTVYNQVILGLIVIPLLSWAHTLLTINILFAIKHISILLMVSVTLALLFGMKIYQLFFRKELPQDSSTVEFSRTSHSSTASKSSQRIPKLGASSATKTYFVQYREAGFWNSYKAAQLYYFRDSGVVILKRVQVTSLIEPENADTVAAEAREWKKHNMNQTALEGPILVLRDLPGLTVYTPVRDHKVLECFLDNKLFLTLNFDETQDGTEVKAILSGQSSLLDQKGPIATSKEDISLADPATDPFDEVNNI